MTVKRVWTIDDDGTPARWEEPTGGGSVPGIVAPFDYELRGFDGANYDLGIVDFMRLSAPAGTYGNVSAWFQAQGNAPYDPVFFGVWDATTLALLAETADASDVIDTIDAANPSSTFCLITIPLVAPLVLAAGQDVYVGVLNAAGGGHGESVYFAYNAKSGSFVPALNGQDDHSGGGDYATPPDPLVIATPNTAFGYWLALAP